MTGPEHYRTAERLLANRPDAAGDGTSEANQIAAAHVHATLALAAATALAQDIAGVTPIAEFKAWAEAAGEAPTPAPAAGQQEGQP